MALNVEKASVSKSKDNKKRKKAQKVLAPGGAAGVKKPKGKCYHCKQPGHHKKQLPAYLAMLNKQGFQETRRLSEDEVCVFQANGEPAPALALGDIRVSFSNDRVLVLKDVLYVPSIRRNLILVSKIMDAGYNAYFGNNSAIIKFNKCFIYTAARVHDLFILDISPHVLQQPKN
uniref:Uncharacterized protein LOC104226118 n=1 Tax=Nicotiana sylvestris TaxID=4096 RepID=A0A1U7WCC9_NICSY|nr:PREDICTED: uncharacterized protein LOC104226118 [Nicotiana sylvestris]